MCIGVNQPPIGASSALLIEMLIFSIGNMDAAMLVHLALSKSQHWTSYLSYKCAQLELSLPSTLHVHLTLHSPCPYVSSCTLFLVIPLQLVLYFMLIQCLSPIIYQLLSISLLIWNQCLVSCVITIQRTIKMHNLREYSPMHSGTQPVFIAFQLFDFQPSGFLHCMADDKCSNNYSSIRKLVPIG